MLCCFLQPFSNHYKRKTRKINLKSGTAEKVITFALCIEHWTESINIYNIITTPPLVLILLLLLLNEYAVDAYRTIGITYRTTVKIYG